MRVFVVLVVKNKKNNKIHYEKKKNRISKSKYRKNDGSYDIIVPCIISSKI